MIRLRVWLYAILLTGAACGGCSSPTGGGGGGGGNPLPAGTVDVGMQEYTFGPSSITVKVGATVRWTNQGTVAHTTTSDAGVWDSGALGAPSGGGGYGGGSTSGGAFSHTFSTAGTFAYHCSFHQSIGMMGTVTVTP